MINSSEESKIYKGERPSSFLHGKLVSFLDKFFKEELSPFRNQIKGIFLQRSIAFKRVKKTIWILIGYFVLLMTIKIEQVVN